MIALGLIGATVISLFARYWAPIHDSLGFDALAPVLVISGLATVTSVATWRWVQRSLWERARAAQVVDFALWDLAPVAVAYSCSEPWGVLLAMVIHGAMVWYHAKICRRSWIMRTSVMVTWLPLLYLSSEYPWVPVLGVFTLCMFWIVNLSAHISRTEAEARDERMRRDFKALTKSFSRLVRKQWPEGGGKD